MRYVVMMNRFGYQIAGHLSAEEIFEYKQQGYRLVVNEVISYRVRPEHGRSKKCFTQKKSG